MSQSDPQLSGPGRELYDQLNQAHDFAPHELATLVEACRTLTLAARLEREATDAPAVVTGSMKQPIANPLFGELRQQRLAFSALMNRLDLPDVDEAGEARELGMARTQLARRAALARHRKA